jgi:hypothetical protein
LAYREPSPVEVDIAPSKAEHLTTAHPAVGGHEPCRVVPIVSGQFHSAAPFWPAPPWLSTRAFAGVTATLGVGLSALLARSLAVDIGPTLRSSRQAWFAGLLDALGDWWDGMGPGGHGLVVGAGLALLVLGTLLLLRRWQPSQAASL